MPEQGKPIERAVDRTKRSVAFPEGGAGVLLRLRFSDLKKVEAKFGHDYLAEAEGRFSRFETEFVELMLEWSAKKEDGSTPAKVVIDDVALSTKDLVVALKDALFLTTMDMTFAEAQAHFQEQMLEAKRKFDAGEADEEPADPPTPEVFLSGSTAEASGQA